MWTMRARPPVQLVAGDDAAHMKPRGRLRSLQPTAKIQTNDREAGRVRPTQAPASLARPGTFSPRFHVAPSHTGCLQRVPCNAPLRCSEPPRKQSGQLESCRPDAAAPPLSSSLKAANRSCTYQPRTVHITTPIWRPRLSSSPSWPRPGWRSAQSRSPTRPAAAAACSSGACAQSRRRAR